MAITVAQLQDYINSRIKQNSNKEITGTVMKYALTEMLLIVDTKQDTLVSGTTLKTINGTSLLGAGNLVITSDLTIGSTTVVAGAADCVFFQTGTTVSQTTNFKWSSTFLEVRASDATINPVFKIRNSSGSTDMVAVYGDNSMRLTNNVGIGSAPISSKGLYVINSSSTGIESTATAANGKALMLTASGAGGTAIGADINATGAGVGNRIGARFNVSGGSHNLAVAITNGNIGVGTSAVGYGGANLTICMKNTAVPPTVLQVGTFSMYGADIVAGNTAPHFKTENGDVQRIYSIAGWDTPAGTLTRTSFDASTVTLSELGERVAALITDLKTGHQLLKA